MPGPWAARSALARRVCPCGLESFPARYPQTAAMNCWYFRWPASRQMIRIGGGSPASIRAPGAASRS
jgi:hypothetical protein